MPTVAPELTAAVAQRITSTDLDEHAYAVRIDDGTLLDGPEQIEIEHARAHLTPAGQRQAASGLGCKLSKLDSELDTLAARAKTSALKVRVTGELRDRARTGRYAFVHERGQDFAAGIWVVDPREPAKRTARHESATGRARRALLWPGNRRHEVFVDLLLAIGPVTPVVVDQQVAGDRQQPRLLRRST
jgi:hypothetical protein